MVCSDCRYYNPTGDKQGKCERMSDEDFDMLVYADDDSLCPKFECLPVMYYPQVDGITPTVIIDDSWESVSK